MENTTNSGPTSLKGCCGAEPGPGAVPPPPLAEGRASDALRDALAETMVEIPAGFFEMGSNRPGYPVDFDGPRRKVFVSGFRIGRFAVTNALFARFVAESGYQTVAETEGWSYVFHSFLKDMGVDRKAPAGTPWWRAVEGAAWFAPEGPGSTIEGREDHPVVHVSWHDAAAFCAFTGARLPTEAEWEKAARGGLKHKRFPWGNQLVPASGHRHNVWQGVFPNSNSAEDGFVGTCPVGTYAPNGFGLYNMTGNVWEWCADWFDRPTKRRLPMRDPTGPEHGGEKVVKGGSHMCHASYCARYQVHSRTKNTPDSSTGHMGFRVVI